MRGEGFAIAGHCEIRSNVTAEYADLSCMFQDAMVIILDTGRNTVERQGKDGPTFFEVAKGCVQKILMRKVSTSRKSSGLN